MPINVTSFEYQIVQHNIAAFLEKEYGIINQSANKLKHLAAVALDHPSYQSLEHRFSLISINPKPDVKDVTHDMKLNQDLFHGAYYIQIWSELNHGEGYVWYCIDYAARHGKGESSWSIFKELIMGNENDYSPFNEDGSATILPSGFLSLPSLNVKKMDASELPFSPYKEPMQCDNCEYTGDYNHLPAAQNLSERIGLGGVHTDVECPCCGALCYPVKNGLELTYDECVNAIFKEASDAGVSLKEMSEFEISSSMEDWGPVKTGFIYGFVSSYAISFGGYCSQQYNDASDQFCDELTRRVREKARPFGIDL